MFMHSVLFRRGTVLLAALAYAGPALRSLASLYAGTDRTGRAFGVLSSLMGAGRVAGNAVAVPLFQTFSPAVALGGHGVALLLLAAPVLLVKSYR